MVVAFQHFRFFHHGDNKHWINYGHNNVWFFPLNLYRPDKQSNLFLWNEYSAIIYLLSCSCCPETTQKSNQQREAGQKTKPVGLFNKNIKFIRREMNKGYSLYSRLVSSMLVLTPLPRGTCTPFKVTEAFGSGAVLPKPVGIGIHQEWKLKKEDKINWKYNQQNIKIKPFDFVCKMH